MKAFYTNIAWRYFSMLIVNTPQMKAFYTR